MNKKLFVVGGNQPQINEIRGRFNDFAVATCETAAELYHAVRDLGHVVVAVGCDPPKSIPDPPDAEAFLDSVRSRDLVLDGKLPTDAKPHLDLKGRIDIFERELIIQALGKFRHHRKDTARHLGISRVTLYNKMKSHGLMN